MGIRTCARGRLADFLCRIALAGEVFLDVFCQEAESLHGEPEYVALAAEIAVVDSGPGASRAAGRGYRFSSRSNAWSRRVFSASP